MKHSDLENIFNYFRKNIEAVGLLDWEEPGTPNEKCRVLSLRVYEPVDPKKTIATAIVRGYQFYIEIHTSKARLKLQVLQYGGAAVDDWIVYKDLDEYMALVGIDDETYNQFLVLFDELNVKKTAEREERMEKLMDEIESGLFITTNPVKTLIEMKKNETAEVSFPGHEPSLMLFGGDISDEETLLIEADEEDEQT